MIRFHLTIVCLLAVGSLSAAERQFPILPWHYTSSLCDILDIPHQKPDRPMPELPARSGQLQASHLAEWQAYRERCLRLALDPQPEQPADHFWMVDLQVVDSGVSVAGSARAANLRLEGAGTAVGMGGMHLKPDDAELALDLSGVPAGRYRLALRAGSTSPDLRGPRPLRLVVTTTDGRLLAERVVAVGAEEAPLISLPEVFIGDGVTGWRITAAPVAGIDPVTAAMVLREARIEGPVLIDGQWPPPLQRPPLGMAIDDAVLLRQRLESMVRRAWAQVGAANEAAVAELWPAASAALQRGGLVGGLRQAVIAVTDDPRFLYRERSPGPGVPESVDENEFARRVAFATLGRCLSNDRRHDKILDYLEGGRIGERNHRIKLWRESIDKESAARSIGRLLADDLLALPQALDDQVSLPDTLRQSFIDEARETIAANYRRRRPAAELLNWRHVVVDAHLAAHYDVIAGPPGSLRPISLAADHPRGGLLALGAFLLQHPEPAARARAVDEQWFAGALGSRPALVEAFAGFDGEAVWRGDAEQARALVAARDALRQEAGAFVIGLRRRLARLITGAEVPPPSAEAITEMNKEFAKGESGPSLQSLVEGFLWGDDPLVERRH